MAEELKKMISDAVNSNWSVARDTVKDTVSIGVAHAEAALMPAVEPIVEQAKAGIDVATARLQAYKTIADAKYAEATALAEEWPNTAAVLGAGAVIVAVPNTRRILYNQTILRLMSKQGRINHVEKRASWLKEGLETQTQEYQKLQERIALAEDDFLRGRQKLQAAGAQLRQLASQAKRYQGQALELSAEVRVLPAPAAPAGKPGAQQLRAEVDAAFATARRQRGAIEAQLKRIVGHGVYI